MQKIRKMRLLGLTVLFLCILCLNTGCIKKEAEPEKVKGEGTVTETEAVPVTEERAVKEDAEDEIAEPEEVISAQVSKTVKEAYGNDRITLLTKEVNDVCITMSGNEDAQEEINAFFAERNRALEDTVELYTDLVETAYYAWRDAGESTEWKPYELVRKYSVKRVDEQMICIVEDSYVYTGGDRGNAVRVAYNFDTWTGSRLSLETAASHLDEIRMESIAYIGELLQEPEYARVLKSNYTDYLEDILTDGTWYTDEAGLYVICNEDVIAPAKEGIMEFFLPYEEVDVIDELYIPEEIAEDQE